MRERVVPRDVRVAPRVRLERRCVAAAENARPLLVLEHDHDHVREGRDRRDGGAGRASGERKEREQDREALHASSSTTRRRQTCRPPTTRTSTITPPIAPYTP